jgi:pilus assembly protein CpaD
MTGSGGGVAPVRAGLLGATVGGGLLVLMLAGCVDTTTAPSGVNLGDYQAPARDLVGVSLYTAEHVIRLGPGGTVSQTERNNLEAFLTAIAYNRPESVRIVVHGRATPTQRGALTAALTADGVGPEHILWARDGELGRPVPRGTLVLAVERAIAIAPSCPGFMGHPSAPTDNLIEPNFGCSNVYNLAAMVADPHHLYRGASSIYYLGQRGAADVTAYRTDKVKPLPKINEGFTVGGGSGGGGQQ